MFLEDLAKDTYPELLLGAARDLVADLERAEATRRDRLARRAQRRRRIAGAIGALVGSGRLVEWMASTATSTSTRARRRG